MMLVGVALITVSLYGCFKGDGYKSQMGISRPESTRYPLQSSQFSPGFGDPKPTEPHVKPSALPEQTETFLQDEELSSQQGLIEDSDIEEAESAKSELNENETSLKFTLFLCRLSNTQWKRGELEKAIDTLDRAYACLLKINPGNDSRLTQEKDDLRLTISRRILEIHSSRLVAANGQNHNEIPITINKHVQDEIDSFTVGRERIFFSEAYRRSGRYRVKIEAAMQEAGLPTELSWLPLIESGFKVNAFSSARALGLWQFIPSTGYRYDLNRDKYIDERLDPEKSTRGAIEYLKELHGLFGDWTTVLAAYNCGEHRVLQTIQQQNIDYLDNFWDLYERLPTETARYVPRFLATLHIVRNPEKYGLNEAGIDSPLHYEIVPVSRQASLKSISRATQVDFYLLKELNAELRRGILPTEGYNLRVPLGARRLVAEKVEDLPTYQMRSARTEKIHKVQKGDSLYLLSKKYGVSLKRLMLANRIQKPRQLHIGSVLKIPSNYKSESHTVATKSSYMPKANVYAVRPGDSLYKIAKHFATTTEKIQHLNKLPSTRLSVGQVLEMPKGPVMEDSPDTCTDTYIVQKGDTIWSIALDHHMSINQLMVLNNLKQSDTLQINQKLLVEK
jgi:membrane-bound lytic murein transglycosylase D